MTSEVTYFDEMGMGTHQWKMLLTIHHGDVLDRREAVVLFAWMSEEEHLGHHFHYAAEL